MADETDQLTSNSNAAKTMLAGIVIACVVGLAAVLWPSGGGFDRSGPSAATEFESTPAEAASAEARQDEADPDAEGDPSAAVAPESATESASEDSGAPATEAGGEAGDEAAQGEGEDGAGSDAPQR